MKVLVTRCRGYSVDPQRLHDNRPEIVYEVVGEYEILPRAKRQMRSPLWTRVLVTLSIIYLIYGLASAFAGERLL